MSETIFALDIGTRSVVGIILKKTDDKYELASMLVQEHDERAMVDGQIHDVLAVANVISKIKAELEEVHGPLKKVCVAAAGRALKTERSTLSISVLGKPMITQDDIVHLELSAVQQAQTALAKKHQAGQSCHYYCVGYSVMRYRIDGEEIGSLIDQQGTEATVEVIATFLPRLVVESLIASLQRADLEMDALTLEPIAALNVLIPPTMRRLNVALVDIGAGTSDIAITDSGAIVAYGMVPIAGDEITEAISDHYLLDFPLAENVKKQLNTCESVTITDILGFEMEIPKAEVMESIDPTIEKLASSISEEILTLNNNIAPKAIMLIGGGSLTPEIPRRLAEKMKLPENRVAIRGIDAIQKLQEVSEDVKRRPELVTPVGIAIASKQSPVQYISVYVNDQQIRLFDMKTLTIGDCVLAAGVQMNKLYGRPGMATVVTFNGETISFPGQYGKAPVILKNGKITTFEDLVRAEDSITVEKGLDGGTLPIQLKELIDVIPTKTVKINGTTYVIEATILLNGKKATPDVFIQDRDVIELSMPKTIEDLLKQIGIADLLNHLQPLIIHMNKRQVELKEFSGCIHRNGKEVKPFSTFEHNDVILITRTTVPTVKDVAEERQMRLSYSIPVIYNGEQLTLTKSSTEWYRQDERLSEDSILSFGDSITTVEKKQEPFIVQDIFSTVQVDFPKDKTTTFELLRNGSSAAFHEQLAPGDEIDITWKMADDEVMEETETV